MEIDFGSDDSSTDTCLKLTLSHAASDERQSSEKIGNSFKRVIIVNLVLSDFVVCALILCAFKM